MACGGIAELADNIQKNDIVAIETLKGELVASGNSLLTSDEILEADSGFAVNVSNNIVNNHFWIFISWIVTCYNHIITIF